VTSRKSLVVTQTRDQRSNVETDDVVVLNELIENASTERVDSHVETLSKADLDLIAGLPLFRMLWPRFANAPMYDIKMTGIPTLVVVYRELESIVRERDVQVIECVGVHSYYLSAVVDLARNEGIELESDDGPTKKPRMRGLLRGVLGYLYVVVESLFFATVGVLRNDRDETAFVFVPHLNRFGSMEPVIETADYDNRVVIPVTTLEWYRSTARGQWVDARPYDPTPITRFATFSVVASQVRALGRLCFETLVTKTFKRRLQRVVAEELDVRLDTAIDHSLGNTYDIHFSSIPNLFLARQMIEDTGCRGLAVGAQSLRQQAFLVASEEAGIDAYHIPHTIPLHHEPIPRPETTHFVPGPISTEYLRESDHVSNGERAEPIGRPLLERLRNDRPEVDDGTNVTSVLIATQPYADDIRSTFVTDVIDALPESVSVTVKPHPNENPAFYESLVRDTESDVTVVASDLESHVKRADLTFVINTNVGIESVALGTPCVSVNYWEPRMFVRPYAQYGPIPVMRSRDELVDFLADLDDDNIRELRDEQVTYMDEEYQPNDDVAERINDYMAPEPS
jgi:hypothetical protein